MVKKRLLLDFGIGAVIGVVIVAMVWVWAQWR